ncbi:MAG: DUF3823 domain-containing protein [Proteiniphilum sp.]|jgi:hypothetical protein|nr:DUF3823 domain-containing protein [Proteiniphilum sp.]
MKLYKYLAAITTLAVALVACGLDNYDAPSSTLQGRITYQGKALGLRGTGEAVQLQLYQDGYELRNYISVFVNQDGTFRAKLFDGEYKLVTRDNNGPWVNTRDTVTILLKGSASVDVEVTPYYLITDESISLDGSTLRANLTVTQIAKGEGLAKEIERISLLVSSTSFVDEATNIVREDFMEEARLGKQTLIYTLDKEERDRVASAKFLYARLSVRAQGASESIYSEIVQLR